MIGNDITLPILKVMKILKISLIVLAVLIAIPLIASLFAPTDFKAQGTVTIDRPRQEVFDYVRQVGNQRDFSVWFKMDPAIKIASEGTDGTEGFVLNWESEVVGDGSQTITRIVEHDSVLSILDFGFGEPPQGFFALKEVNQGQTEVTWGIVGKSSRPWNLVSLFMDMNKDFDTGVQNLKEVLEAESPSGGSTALLDYYRKTYNTLERSVASLTPGQLHYHPSDSVWSVSQCLEHIVLTEDMLFGLVKQYMEKPANPERRNEIKISDEDIKSMVTDRSKKFKAMESLMARGKYEDAGAALEALKEQRAEVLSFINDTPVSAMRDRVNDAPAGAVDVYQYLLFLAGHTARHTLQIEEVKASPGFPAN